MTPNSLPAIPSRVKSKATVMAFTLLVIFSMILSACGGGSSQNNTSTTGSKHILKIASQSNDFTQDLFNPFNSHPNGGVGLMYETLYFVNVNDG